MRYALTLCAAALSASLLVGCKDEPAANTPVPPSTAPTSMPTTGDMTSMMPSSMPSMSASMPSMPSMSTTMPAMTPPAMTPPAMTPSTTTPPATPDASVSTDDAKTKAMSIMDDVKKAVKDNKLDDADAGLKKLDDLKSKLPADMQTQIDELKKTVEGAKKMLGNIPSGLPGLSK